MPVKRRRVRDEDEEPEEEETPRSRRRARDDDEEEEEPEERPRRRRARAEDDEDEEEPPKRSRRARDDDDDEPEDDEDDDDERPRKGKRGSVRKGWKGYQEGKAKGGDYPEELKISSDHELIKFLEDDPLASYRQHWIDNPPGDIRKKSWTCLETDCPLCDTLGDRPRLLTVFNVLHVNTGGEPENKILVLGVKATGQILNLAEDKKTKPLSKLYYSVSKSGKGQQTAYNFRPVKDRDLEEDWEIQPLTEDELDEAFENIYDESVVQVPTKRQLREIADALVDEDD